jgi:SAM-dependent methyltransferase
MTDQAADYDELPYPGQAYLESHPDCLATVATLFGLAPPPVERCRVLELGCGDGANLIPMAAGLPGATFVGVDLSARQVAAGRATSAALGLSNIALHHLDLRAVPAGWGEFDYIIAHGVYSWVPPAVQEAIFAVCRRHLAPDGVAYVSFNALPGWRLYGIVRDFLRFHTRDLGGLRARATEALRLLERLAATVPEPTDPYANLLYYVAGQIEAELAPLGDARVAYVGHDLVADINEALYLDEFLARAARHDLHYLAPADFPTGGLAAASPAVVAAVAPPAGPTAVRQQYADFLTGCAFHRVLLSRHAGAAERAVRPERLERLWLASPARPAGAGQPPVEFVTDDNTTVAPADPLTQAALLHLSERWPQAEPFDRLHRAARARLGRAVDGPAAASASRLAAALLQLSLDQPGVVRLHAHAPRVVATPGERPAASPVAREVARASRRVPNLYHQMIELDAWLQAVLCLLDGRRDRPALLAALAEQVAAGRLALADGAGRPARAAPALLAERLAPALAWLARAALLIG